jgi:hypothetical protein
MDLGVDRWVYLKSTVASFVLRLVVTGPDRLAIVVVVKKHMPSVWLESFHSERGHFIPPS